MPAPDALLLISTHCPHCPAMLSALADLVKQGTIGRLEAVNLEQHPEVGQALGVRSVPWVRIGRIELAGVHSKAELAEWAAKADSEAGLADWFHMLLKEGQLPRAQAMIEADPALLAAVLPIVGNVEASLNVRLGAGVLLEELRRQRHPARAAAAAGRTVATRRRAGAGGCLPLPGADCGRRGAAVAGGAHRRRGCRRARDCSRKSAEHFRLDARERTLHAR